MRSSASAPALALFLAGCVSGPDRGGGEVGLATWYGEELAGRPTASGAPFDPARMTAAHRTLPLGSVAEVTNLSNGRSVRVLINDRGPRDRSRVIDLSRAAAQAIGTDRDPHARVAVRAVGGASDRPVIGFARPLPKGEHREPVMTSGYLVQIAAFASEERARALAEQVGGRVEPAGPVYRVRLGPFASAADAQRARDDARSRGYGDAALLLHP